MEVVYAFRDDALTEHVVCRHEDGSLEWIRRYDDFGRELVDSTPFALEDLIRRGPAVERFPWHTTALPGAELTTLLDRLGVPGRPRWLAPLPHPELFAAAERSHPTAPAAMRRLLAGGAPPDPVDHFGWSPLAYAVRAHADAVARALLEAGADVTRRLVMPTGPWSTPLHELAARNLTYPLTAALDGGAPPDLRDGAGRAPLHVLGADGDHETTALLLLAAGADPDAAADDGRLADDHARMLGLTEVLALIAEARR